MKGRRSVLLPLLAVVLALPAVAGPPRAEAAPLALGAYIPGASEDPALIDAFAREAGRRPAIVLTYKDWSSLPFDRAELGSIWRRGALPMVTWEPWTSSGRGLRLEAIAAGRFDRYLRRAAGSARLWGKPLLVRFAQEMNGGWFPWGRGPENSARDFRRAWKRIVGVFRRQGASNVEWVWSPNEDSGGTHQIAPLFPGDEWVDWVALDGFDFGGSVGWPSFTAIFGSSYERLAKLSRRPVMIAETGANEEGGDKAAWILSALRREAPRFPRLRALIWFNDRRPRADFRIDSSAASLRAFREAVGSPAFAATRADLLSTPRSVAGGTLAPAAPDGGYGAPSFLERLWTELRGPYLWAPIALLVAASAALAAFVVARRRRGRAVT